MLGLSRTSHWKDMDPGYKYSKWFAQRTTQLGPIGISLRVCWAQNSLISDKKLTSKSLRIQDPRIPLRMVPLSHDFSAEKPVLTVGLNCSPDFFNNKCHLFTQNSSFSTFRLLTLFKPKKLIQPLVKLSIPGHFKLMQLFNHVQIFSISLSSNSNLT